MDIMVKNAWFQITQNVLYEKSTLVIHVFVSFSSPTLTPPLFFRKKSDSKILCIFDQI